MNSYCVYIAPHLPLSSIPVCSDGAQWLRKNPIAGFPFRLFPYLLLLPRRFGRGRHLSPTFLLLP